MTIAGFRFRHKVLRVAWVRRLMAVDADSAWRLAKWATSTSEVSWLSRLAAPTDLAHILSSVAGATPCRRTMRHRGPELAGSLGRWLIHTCSAPPLLSRR